MSPDDGLPDGLREHQTSDAPAPALLEDLVVGNRILSKMSILDGFGHVSVRHDKRPDRFLLARSMAPGLVTADDILEFGMDGEPVMGRAPKVHIERFIHSEIYKRRPDVGAIVHSHSPSVIPFTVTEVPLRAIYHMNSFLNGGAPVFEIRETAGTCSDMLIRDARLGAALAESLGDSAVALMRGHGYVVVGSTIKTAVMRAVYTETGAKVQADALKLGPVKYLTPEEAANAAAANDGAVHKAWDLWKAQVLGETP